MNVLNIKDLDFRECCHAVSVGLMDDARHQKDPQRMLEFAAGARYAQDYGDGFDSSSRDELLAAFDCDCDLSEAVRNLVDQSADLTSSPAVRGYLSDFISEVASVHASNDLVRGVVAELDQSFCEDATWTAVRVARSSFPEVQQRLETLRASLDNVPVQGPAPVAAPQDTSVSEARNHRSEPPLIVVSGPSGVGKSTIVQEVCYRDHRFHQAITCTTRRMRPEEAQGIDYYFMSNEKFAQLERIGGLIESVHTRGASYGLPQAELDSIWDRGEIPVVVLDPDGKDNLVKLYPQAFTVYIDADDSEVENRLSWREESYEVIEQRMADNRSVTLPEVKATYDAVIPNNTGKLDECCKNVLKCAYEAFGLSHGLTPADLASQARANASSHGLGPSDKEASLHH